jgi:hypothetical protein
MCSWQIDEILGKADILFYILEKKKEYFKIVSLFKDLLTYIISGSCINQVALVSFPPHTLNPQPVGASAMLLLLTRKLEVRGWVVLQWRNQISWKSVSLL